MNQSEEDQIIELNNQTEIEKQVEENSSSVLIQDYQDSEQSRIEDRLEDLQNNIYSDEGDLLDDDQEQAEFQKDQVLLDSDQQNLEVQIKVKQLKPRQDQLELFKNSLDRNSIIYLPTGTGKTMVSMIAMQYYLMKYGEEKKILFLANTVQLVKQQAQAIKRFLPMIKDNTEIMNFNREKLENRHYETYITVDNAREKVICLHGEKNNQQLGSTKRKQIQNNVKDRRELIKKIQKGSIIVMIAQMFVNCLRRGYVKITDFSFIVLDECHHCKQNHPFNNIMRQFYFEKKAEKVKNKQEQNEKKLPILMGLTASPVQKAHKDLSKISEDIIQLGKNLDSDYVYYNIKEDNKQISQQDRIQVKKVENIEGQQFIPDLIKFYEKVQNAKDPLQQSKHQISVYFPLYYQLIEDLDQIIQTNYQEIEQKKSITFLFKELIHDLRTCLLTKAVDVLLELGNYALYRVLNDLINQFLKIQVKLLQEKKIKQQIDDCLNYFIVRFKDQYGACKKQNFSSKFLKLVQIILQEQWQGQKRILIFVGKRRTVRYLQRIMTDYAQQLSKSQDQTKAIRSVKSKLQCKGVTGVSQRLNKNDEFKDNQQTTEDPTNYEKQSQIVKLKFQEFQKQIQQMYEVVQGSNKGLKRQQNKMNASKIGKKLLQPEEKYSTQIQTIKSFRTKNSFPILITTSVTEEGFDIPDCNLVISFNLPTQLKSFIQIKGRARHKQSKYYILAYQDQFETMQRKKRQYIVTIKQAQIIAIQNLAPRGSNKGIKKGSYKREQNYKVVKLKSGAIINTNYAVQLLKAYLNTIKAPDGKTVSKLRIQYFLIPQTGYICYLVMKGTPMDIVKSQICTTKIEALRNAAFYAVKQLRNQKHLKDDLKPKNEAQLYDEGQLEKFNDLQTIKTDAEYLQIFRNSVQILIDQKNNKRQKLYFKYLRNDKFDFPQINNHFNDHLKEFKTKPFKFQIYRLNITNRNRSISFQNVNTNEDIHLGLLTCFKNQDTNQIFSKFRYEFKSKLDQSYSLELVDVQFQLNYQRFMKLREIHMYLVACLLNQQIFYFSKKTGIQPTVTSWKSKIKDGNYQIDQDRLYHPLFVILQKQKNKFRLSDLINQRVMKHQEIMLQVYKFHNKHKNKNQKFPRDLSSQLIQYHKYENKIKYKGNYLMQSITQDFLLHKVVLFEQEFISVENMAKLFKHGGNKNKEINFQKRHLALKSIYPQANSPNDAFIKVQLARKVLKTHLHSYLKNQTITKKFDQEGKDHFLSEFARFPLDLETLFQMNLAKQYILPKVQDYIRAYYFKNQHLRELSMTAKNSNQNEIYTIKMKINLIIKYYKELTLNLKKHPNSFMKELGAKFERGYQKSYKYPIEGPEKIIETSGLNKINKVIKEKIPIQQFYNRLNINQILKCLTSRIYKSNKKENYEEYQFIGDSVLKLLATIQIFATKSIQQQGELHLARANIISNANLHKYSIKKKLFQYVLTTPLKQYPAPFKVKYDQQAVKEEYYKQTGIKKVNSASFEQGFCYVPGKIHADVVQALVGVYFLNRNGLAQCQYFLYCMNILKFSNLNLCFQYEQSVDNEINCVFFKEIQKRLMHEFKNKNLLFQAFTHRTFENILETTIDKQIEDTRNNLQNLRDHTSRVIASKIKKYQLYYERLEFLGDAVLDVVAIQYIFQKENKELDEGTFSLYKQASVSNRTLGLIALYWGLDEFILIEHKQTIQKFRKIKQNFQHYYRNPDQIFTAELAPLKILGDVFQAFVGAVFLDAKFDYDYTKMICRRLMQPFIDHFTEDTMMKKYPQYKYQQYLKTNNFEGIKIVKDFQVAPINGQYQYVLKDRANKQINRCRQVTQKKAWDKLLQQYVNISKKNLQETSKSIGIA